MNDQIQTSSRPARLEDVLGNPRIPTLPMVAVEVLDLTRSVNVNLDEVARVIQNDQSLAIKIIRTVNSSYYGLSRPCTTIKQAIVYLGLNAVKTLALGFSLVDSIDSSGDDISFDYLDYWRRAIYSAAAARDIAQFTRSVNPEEAFLAALIQDVGMIALNRAFGDMYLQAVDVTRGDHGKLSSVEQRTFKLNHADVGAALAARWKLPAPLIESIRYHHRPDETPDQWKQLVQVIQISYLAASVIGKGKVTGNLQRFRQRAQEWFGLDTARCDELLILMKNSAGELSRLFRIHTGVAADIENLLARAEELQIEHQGELLTASTRHGAWAEQAQNASDARVLNAEKFRDLLNQGFERMQARQGCLAVLTVAIDHPALLRESVGEMRMCEAGRELVTHIERQVGVFGVVGRYTDDVLAVMMPHHDAKQAVEEAECLCRLIEVEMNSGLAGRTRREDAHAGCVTVSIGVAAVEPGQTEDGSNAESLLAAAGRALAGARESGGNCVRTTGHDVTDCRAA